MMLTKSMSMYVHCHFSPRVGSAVGGATEARACPHYVCSHDYRHTDLPSGGSDEYVFIRTSQGKDYQLHKSSAFQEL